MIPSVDVAATLLGPFETATKTPFPNAMEVHDDALGMVLSDQVNPSDEVAARVPFEAVTKIPFPNIIGLQNSEEGKEAKDQIDPSEEVKAKELLFAGVTKTPFPKATEK